jgi:hypothetical protein
METGKGLILAGVAATAVFGVSRLYAYKKLSDKLEITAGGMIHKVSLDEVIIKIDLGLKNPTETSIKLKHPYLVFEHNGEKFATSEIKNSSYELDRNNPEKHISVLLPLKTLKLLTTTPALLSDIRNKGKIEINVKVSTAIEGVLDIPINKDVPITIAIPALAKK